jgi:putative redox protein
LTEIKQVGAAVAFNSANAFKTAIKANGFDLIADEPVSIGGTDEGPTPGDYLCVALAACKTITLRMYVQRKQWDVGEIDVNVNLTKVDGPAGAAHIFNCEILVSKTVADEQKQRLVQIAKACPISKLLSKSAEVITVIN